MIFFSSEKCSKVISSSVGGRFFDSWVPDAAQ